MYIMICGCVTENEMASTHTEYCLLAKFQSSKIFFWTVTRNEVVKVNKSAKRAHKNLTVKQKIEILDQIGKNYKILF